jgi:hypothetical protein
MYTRFNIHKFYFCPRNLLIFFLWISGQTATFALYNIKRLVLVTVTESVYCAVRAWSLSETLCLVLKWLIHSLFSTVHQFWGKSSSVIRVHERCLGYRSSQPRVLLHFLSTFVFLCCLTKHFKLRRLACHSCERERK